MRYKNSKTSSRCSCFLFTRTQSQLCYRLYKWNIGAAVPTLKSCRPDKEERRKSRRVNRGRGDCWPPLSYPFRGINREWNQNCHQAFKWAVMQPHFYSEVIISVISPTSGSAGFPCNLFKCIGSETANRPFQNVHSSVRSFFLEAIHIGH